MPPESTNPLVSIITGYYNRTENLIESVSSILEQNYSNFEYIIFDDCSTDRTTELLSSFKDPRLKLYRHETNLGLTKGLIQAIAKSKGDLIAIHGAGDVSLPNRIQRQVDLLQNKPEVGLVGCLIEDIHDSKSSIYSPIGNQFTHGEVMYRKNLYYQVGGYNAFFPSGQFTHLKAELLSIAKGAWIDEVLYRRIHFSNGITRNPKKRFAQKFLIKSGAFLSANGNSLMRFDRNRLLLETYISLIKENSDADQSAFFSNFSGSKIAKLLLHLHKIGLISKSMLLRLIKS